MSNNGNHGNLKKKKNFLICVPGSGSKRSQEFLPGEDSFDMIIKKKKGKMKKGK